MLVGRRDADPSATSDLACCGGRFDGHHRLPRTPTPTERPIRTSPVSPRSSPTFASFPGPDPRTRPRPPRVRSSTRTSPGAIGTTPSRSTFGTGLSPVSRSAPTFESVPSPGHPRTHPRPRRLLLLLPVGLPPLLPTSTRAHARAPTRSREDKGRRSRDSRGEPCGDVATFRPRRLRWARCRRRRLHNC